MTRTKKLLITTLIMAAAIVIILAVCMTLRIPPFQGTPTLTLKGSDTVNITFGGSYKEPGYTAKTAGGKDITRSVKVSRDQALDQKTLEKPGKYEITYEVSYQGRSATAKRTINVRYAKPDPSSSSYGHGIAIVTYQNVYNEDNPPQNVNSASISTTRLEAHLRYLVDNGYYFPSWKELRDYIDGKIELPEKSVVLTFDNVSDSFFENAVPLLEKYDVRATAFIVCKGQSDVIKKYGNLKHVRLESNSYDLHRGGGSIGHGGIFTALSQEEGLSDLKKSIDMLGSRDAFAYPYGDYNETCEKAAKEAGFRCAVTTKSGKAAPGDDPYALPRIRTYDGMNSTSFAAAIAPEGTDIYKTKRSDVNL